eukprot:CAMPEP_0194481264 /NCGR_PEP_ID=MMETSP0253-20130528/3767_1 /TAXON_ID=2966 /ORGANISM="Noctiluca scintillans" /LENGTH=98 /DNA_ID=CAMNT_0039320735 /DNA_START=388 /DNA_END=684 /DNA_ORIENTATION=-
MSVEARKTVTKKSVLPGLPREGMEQSMEFGLLQATSAKNIESLLHSPQSAPLQSSSNPVCVPLPTGQTGSLQTSHLALSNHITPERAIRHALAQPRTD